MKFIMWPLRILLFFLAIIIFVMNLSHGIYLAVYSLIMMMAFAFLVTHAIVANNDKYETESYKVGLFLISCSAFMAGAASFYKERPIIFSAIIAIMMFLLGIKIIISSKKSQEISENVSQCTLEERLNKGSCMFKRGARRAWFGNIGGLIIGSIIVPLLMKRPALTTDPGLWIVVIGFIGALLCIPAIIYFKRCIVANHDFSDDGLGLLQHMQAWSTLAFLPFGAGAFHYIKTGQLWFYAVAVVVSCILISLFNPMRKNA